MTRDFCREAPIRSAALALSLCVTFVAPATSQERVRIDGRIVERGTEFGLASGSVRLDGGPEIPADVEGRFRIEGVAPGDHVLTARAYGYAVREIPLVVRADTSLVVELDPEPVPLDSLLVEGRSVTVEGRVLERETGRRLMDVEVRIDRGERTWTDAHGRFEVEHVPAGPPFRVSVRGFGYMPVRTVLSAFQDTSLVFELEKDPVAQRMIAVQVERLEERARPLRSVMMPALDRDFMERRGNATALDLVIERYGRRLGRITCLLVDDQQRYIPRGGGGGLGWSRRAGGGSRYWEGLEELAGYLAPEIQRIEVLEYGAFPRGYMLRIYTRDFIRRMTGGAVELAKPKFLAGFGDPICR